jgi:hypothetical protein
VGVASLSDLPVEAFGVVATFVPASKEVGYVGVQDAGTPLVRRARWWLLEILVAVDSAGAYSKLAADVPQIRSSEVQTPDVSPLLYEALVALTGLLFLAGLPTPGSIRAHRTGSTEVRWRLAFCRSLLFRGGCLL